MTREAIFFWIINHGLGIPMETNQYLKKINYEQ